MTDQPYLSLSKTKSSHSHHGYHKKLILQLNEDDQQHIPMLRQNTSKSRHLDQGTVSKSKIQNIAQLQEMFKQFKHFKCSLQSQTPVIQMMKSSQISKKPQSQSKSTIDAKEISFEDKQKVMIQTRKTMFKIVMDNKLRSQSIKDYGFNLRPLFNQVIRKNDSILEQKIQESRLEKRKSDLFSRSPFSNAYYATKALSKRSRMNVYERLIQNLPADSRFQQE
ncbi:unnamed protein product [Paramecium primaurelia]|uniref:Uncharacterized protein n=2 Tax=Paramecium TaxID=5884 RepID=A0A8S1WGN9_9CILI|nr:unnamed protein product [Paramecium primaurelia]CAD8189218.1 unnamed protein product [Paramecium pentaurelia]